MKTFQCQFQVFELNSAKQTGDITQPSVCKEFDLIMFYFKAILASRGYHVYKESSWSNAKIDEEVKVELETNTKSLSTDPHAFAIKTKNPYFNDWKTVGHIPREISPYVGNVSGTLKSLKYKPSPISSGGLEVLLLLKFSGKDKWVVDTMEEFVLNFYSYEYSENLSVVDNKDDDEDDDDYQAIMIKSEETDSQETEAQSEIQETKSQETETESQSSNIDLQINEDIPVPIIID